MDTTELRNIFRDEFFDAVAPYLVSDLLVYTYIDDAQKMFCRLTEGIEDARSFTIAVEPGTEWYDLDTSILKLRRVTNALGRPVDLVSAELTEQRGIRFEGQTGPPKALVTGAEKGAVRVWPKPDTANTLTLSVFRLPRDVGEGDRLEIDPQHHLALLMWVKHKAYGIHDTEVSNPQKADEFEARFRAYCAAAKTEQGRARHDAGTVTYGGY